MGIGPGNLASMMPARESDMARGQRDLTRGLREQAAALTGAATQIGSGGLLVNDGGSITIDDGGSLNIIGGGALNVPDGGLNSAGAINATTDITAGGTVSGSAVAATGAVTGATVSATGDIDSNGRVYSAGAVISPGSRATIVSTGFVNAYLDSSGVLGYQPSTKRVKKNLQPVPDELADAFFALTPQMGHYLSDADTDPLRVFFIAEDVAEAGFGPDVVPLDDQGLPAAVNSQNLVPMLLEVIKRLEARVTVLESAGAGN